MCAHLVDGRGLCLETHPPYARHVFLQHLPPPRRARPVQAQQRQPASELALRQEVALTLRSFQNLSIP